MWRNILVCLGAIFSVSAAIGFNDDPCTVQPVLKDLNIDKNTTLNAVVPDKCNNGTFYWDWPVGHTMLAFHNPLQKETSICLRDYIGGQAFIVTDMTHNMPVGEFDYKTWTCTEPSTSQKIVLKVDAPVSQRYMGAFSFRIDQ